MEKSPFEKITIIRGKLFVISRNYSLTYLSTHSFALKSYILTKLLAVFTNIGERMEKWKSLKK
jgi:hypothetical protein